MTEGKESSSSHLVTVWTFNPESMTGEEAFGQYLDSMEHGGWVLVAMAASQRPDAGDAVRCVFKKRP